jgi:hypothetical protein
VRGRRERGSEHTKNTAVPNLNRQELSSGDDDHSDSATTSHSLTGLQGNDSQESSAVEIEHAFDG